MAIDSEKLNLASQFIHFLWHGPITAIAVMIILAFEIGYAPALAGMAFIVSIIPLQHKLALLIGRFRRKMVEQTDERVKLINECLQAIRVIKLYAWEAPMEQRINAVRQQETSFLYQYLNDSAKLRELMFSAQPVAAIIIFVTAAYGLQKPLTVVQIFRMLAFLNITRFPLNLLAQAMKNVNDGLVSIKRLNDFFVSAVLDNIHTRQLADNPSIKIEHATFSWQDKAESAFLVVRRNNLENVSSPTSTTDLTEPLPIDSPTERLLPDYFMLREIHFQSKASNELIAVIGTVGSGKSSLLSAMLSEMVLYEGSMEVAGTIAYCSQTPWIQNLSLKQNIFFHIPVNQSTSEMTQLYNQAIRAAALLPDIATLPMGDETESKSTRNKLM